jgi:hypothetical protein
MTTFTYGADMAYPMHRDSETGEVTFTCMPHGTDPSRCEACAQAEREAMATAAAYTVYHEPLKVVTFGGFRLGSVTCKWRGPRRYTPTGGSYRMTYLRVTDLDGKRWHGKYNDDSGNAVTLRRCKA